MGGVEKGARVGGNEMTSVESADLPTVETSWDSAGKLHCTNYLIVQTALHAKPVQ